MKNKYGVETSKISVSANKFQCAFCLDTPSKALKNLAFNKLYKVEKYDEKFNEKLHVGCQSICFCIV